MLDGIKVPNNWRISQYIKNNYLQFDCKSIKLHAKLPAYVQTSKCKSERKSKLNQPYYFMIVTNKQMRAQTKLLEVEIFQYLQAFTYHAATN